MTKKSKRVGRMKTDVNKYYYGGYEPMKPSEPILAELPSKTIMTKPELLPPITTIDIDPNEEVIDLNELRAHGRYAIISYDSYEKKQFLVSDNITPRQEAENPEYARVVAMNKAITDTYEQRLRAYKSSMEKLTRIDETVIKAPQIEIEPTKEKIRSRWHDTYGDGIQRWQRSSISSRVATEPEKKAENYWGSVDFDEHPMNDDASHVALMPVKIAADESKISTLPPKTSWPVFRYNSYGADED